MKRILLTILFITLMSISFGQTAETFFEPLKFRNIGPFRGGRSVSAVGVLRIL